MYKYFLICSVCFLVSNVIKGQQVDNSDDLTLISNTLKDYIEGTSQGQPERLKRAFHPDFNLYSVTEEDSLRVWDGEDYVSNFKEGKKNNRIGRIIAIDHENNAATAKVEIVVPGYKIFTDYFLLLKYEGSWKIVHKSYTSRKESE